jgi:ferredoxin
VKEIAQQYNIPCEIKAIDRFKDIIIPWNEGKILIGFVYPTHGFNIPYYMLKFIWKFPSLKNADVFLLSSRAGMKLWGWHTPGISGVAKLLPLIILWIKGFDVTGMLPLDMPSNWISIRPGLNKRTIDSIVQRCEKITKKFAESIVQGRRYYRYHIFLSLPFDIALFPIAFGYLMYARFFLSKTFLASVDCNDCKLCEENCPTGSIKIMNNRPYWTMNCESCMRCMNICPHKAIQTSHSFALIIAYLASLVPFSLWIHEKISEIQSPYSNILNRPVDFVINWIVTMGILFTFYKILFSVTANKYVNNFFTYTSLTRYWRRYKAPGIKVKDFKNDFH